METCIHLFVWPQPAYRSGICLLTWWWHTVVPCRWPCYETCCRSARRRAEGFRRQPVRSIEKHTHMVSISWEESWGFFARSGYTLVWAECSLFRDFSSPNQSTTDRLSVLWNHHNATRIHAFFYKHPAISWSQLTGTVSISLENKTVPCK